MKTVFNNDEIPHLWAHQTQSEARGAGSISFRDSTGYSYAAPICRHAVTRAGELCVLFTTKTYSVTTSKHTSAFRCAIPSGVPVFHVLDVRADSKAAHAANVRERDAHIALIHSQVIKTRSGTLKAQSLSSQLQREMENRNAYAAAFKVRVKPIDTSRTEALAQKLARDAEKARKASEKANRERIAREAQEAAEDVQLWIAGQKNHIRHHSRSMGALLRANDDEMETSQGARVPLTHAKRAIARVAAVRAAGQPWHRNGSTLPVGHYHIDSIDAEGNVIAGCHRIAWTEIERFAQSQGWLATQKD